MTMHEISVASEDGYRVRTFVGPWDPGKATIVVVLPFGAAIDMAQPLCLRMLDCFNVVTWQARMILDDPSSTPDLSRTTPEMHVADMVSILSLLSVPRAGVIGYCSGAGIALMAAQRHPDRLSRLALVSGEYVLPEHTCPRSRHQIDVDNLLPLAAASRKNAIAIFKKLNDRPTPNDDPIASAVNLPFSHPEFLYRFAVNYLAYRRVNLLEVAEDVPHAALVAVGDRDEQVTVRSSEMVQQRLSGGRLHVDPTADHYDVCRGVTALNDVVLRFLSAEWS